MGKSRLCVAIDARIYPKMKLIDLGIFLSFNSIFNSLTILIIDV
jgi:hypothetical protein